jgi:hypothetical protein
MGWKDEPPELPDLHPAARLWLPLRISRGATYLALCAISIWTLYFVVHLFSSPPPGCTYTEFLRTVWQAFASGYFWLAAALLVSVGASFVLRRVGGGAA